MWFGCWIFVGGSGPFASKLCSHRCMQFIPLWEHSLLAKAAAQLAQKTWNLPQKCGFRKPAVHSDRDLHHVLDRALQLAQVLLAGVDA
jgi:hypothetical protein